MIERRTIRFDHELLAGLEHPAFSRRRARRRAAPLPDRRDPRRRVLVDRGGDAVHERARHERALGHDHGGAGREHGVVPAALAVRRAGRTARTSTAASRARTTARTRTCSRGYVFDELIAPSDVLLDLHGGDMVEALEPFALYDESPVEEQAHALAVAFGLPYVVRAARAPSAPSAGRRRARRPQAGIPGVIAEAGGLRPARGGRASLHLDGLANALRHLGMLPGDAGRRRARTCGASAASSGCARARRAGGSRTVERGRRGGRRRRSGRMRDLFGDVRRGDRRAGGRRRPLPDLEPGGRSPTGCCSAWARACPRL